MFYLIKKLLKIIRFNSYGVFHTRYFDPNTLKIGMNVVVMSKVVLSENVYLGNHSEIYNNVHIGKNVKIGDYTSVNKYTLIDSGIIGNFTSIGPFCHISPGKHDLQQISTSQFIYGRRNSFINVPAKFNPYDEIPWIGNDVWIGSHVVVMQGVKIGDGAVIGAGSVVTKDVEPYEIVVGSPAHHLKYRLNSDLREILLKEDIWSNYNEKKEKLISLYKIHNNITK